MESPWDEDGDNTTFQDVEWSRISEDFTNVGYREGIVAGKEAASQEGFNVGYETIGVPIGREIGMLRGIASVLLSVLKSCKLEESDVESNKALEDAQDISTQLSRIRFSDIMPRDLEAEEHAREHLESEGEKLEENEDLASKRDLETLEDMLTNLTSGSIGGKSSSELRPTIDDVQVLKKRLEMMCNYLKT